MAIIFISRNKETGLLPSVEKIKILMNLSAVELSSLFLYLIL
jgi:hypothetical protein